METESNTRYIKNKFPEKPPQPTDLDSLHAQAIKVLQKDFEHFVSVIKAESVQARASVKKHDYSGSDVFEGAGSYLAMYVRLLDLHHKIKELSAQRGQKTQAAISNLLASQDFNEQALLLKAEISLEKLTEILPIEEKQEKKIQISYYFGGASLYLNGCLLSLMKKDAKSFTANFESLLSYKKLIIEKSGDYYKEILYGVSGYIYCLLVLQTRLDSNTDPEIHTRLKNDILDLVELVIDSGIEDLEGFGYSIDLAKLPKDFRIVYRFHNKEYFGAAHGLFGVLYILLRSYQLNYDAFTKEKALLGQKLIATTRASLMYLLQFQLSSGNFPSSAKSERDSLVQFCHGSPGAVTALLAGAHVFKGEDVGEKCLKAALKAGEDVWKYGILKKGYGLCHGISGNGYSFLSLYRYTHDSMWLYRALCFICTKDDKHYTDEIAKYDLPDRYEVGISDYPYSLMLGLSGDICMEADALVPDSARFPGYEV